MLSLFTLEVTYLIMPAMLLFVLFIVPVPRVSRYVSRVVSFVERPNFHGLSLLLLLTLVTFVTFVVQFVEWRKRYGPGKPRFADLSLEVDWEAKKWRHERNMYIHALATVLCAAIMKFARLYTALEKQQVAAVASKKNA
ncbi:uncharacterized protein Tco025E_05202 [Trypanosoma conorhini]|uniref:BAP29/BAP31 transmembrane domain-containing protein n=1 Tax=Trypanosoma conorhini TaxID=83891 RepID=A0A422PFP8_9TRYP|nr:uncharacterized protein Tco025E_05202 [Trypanosoma conorhini]RNF16519.1 hypothetical protein Tco025E_05202 [Trypanosoma conorhini]